MEPVSVFFGEISPNFYLKNIISTYAKDFSRKKWSYCVLWMHAAVLCRWNGSQEYGT
jgi:hypothetical protein